MALLHGKWKRLGFILLLLGGALVYRTISPLLPEDRTILLRYRPGDLRRLSSVSITWTGIVFQPGEPAAGSTLYVPPSPSSGLLRGHVRLPDGPFWVTIVSEFHDGRTATLRRRLVLDGRTLTIHVPPLPSPSASGQSPNDCSEDRPSQSRSLQHLKPVSVP